MSPARPLLAWAPDMQHAFDLEPEGERELRRDDRRGESRRPMTEPARTAQQENATTHRKSGLSAMFGRRTARNRRTSFLF
jgi:ribosomal protein S9